MIKTNIILDSISELGARLTTYELIYHRLFHDEVLTHRVFSRNSSSSRARPSKKVISSVEADCAYPIYWGKNQSGMSAREQVDYETYKKCKEKWDHHREVTIEVTKELSELGLHKQITNRLIEPHSYITVVLTATDWDNFFMLRCHEDAQPEIRHLSFLMLRDYYNSTPTLVEDGNWHTPYLLSEEKNLDLEVRKKISVVKCARTSYLNQTKSYDYEKDLELYERLHSSGHYSPFEHVATPDIKSGDTYHANFKGWIQVRESLEKENKKIKPSLKEVNNYFKNLENTLTLF